jgi:hypothetical protein
MKAIERKPVAFSNGLVDVVKCASSHHPHDQTGQ